MSKLTKEKFDAIIKSNLIKSDVSADDFGYDINGQNYDLYYANSCFKTFVEDMEKNYLQHYTKYDKGKGSELESHDGKPPKMASVGSSSRFCYLALRDVVGVEFEKSCSFSTIS